MHAYRKDNTASEMYDKDIFLMQVWILNMILKLINNFFVYVCMAIKHIIVLFVETPRKFITANLHGLNLVCTKVVNNTI
jgi:hypothetical protein